MRNLGDYFRRHGRADTDAGSPKRPRIRSLGRRGAEPGPSGRDLAALAREIDAVSHYVAGLKREIGTLRPNEIYRERLPEAHDDLTSIRDTMARSAGAIMDAAEAILTSNAPTLSLYKDEVESHVGVIFEACAFQDLAGQRIARIDGVIAQIEKRLQRFALAVRAADREGVYDRDAILSEARREVLIVEGPQNGAAASGQSAIDDLFA